MQQQRPGRLRSFVQTPAGRAALLGLGLAVVFGTFYISVLVAIPGILIVGLWLPIYAGLKRPRYLAISGLAIMLLVAPLVTLTYTNELLVPVAAASSPATGVDWSVTIDNTTVHSQSSHIDLSLPTSTENYAISAIPGFTANLTGSVVIGTNAVSVPVAFTVVKYALTFTESGLPAGSSWTVAVGSTSLSSTGATVVFQEPNGSYNFRLTDAAGYVPPSSTGIARVHGAASGVSVAFAKSAYPVTFTETGLPVGTGWSLTALATQATAWSDTIVLSLPNGTTPFTAASSAEFGVPPGLTVTVSGTSVSKSVTFTAVTYPVTFTESQLPPSSSWTISVDGASHPSSTATVVVPLSNGTYAYTVGAPHGFTPVVGLNTITVNGGPTGAPIVFNATTYFANFTETGLAPGTAWELSVGATTVNSTAAPISLSLSNGTLAYTVQPIAGYTATTSGSVTIAGHPTGVTVAFSPVRYLATFTETHLASGSTWVVSVNGINHTSRLTTIQFNFTNGSYTYQVGPADGKTPPAPNATFVVDGAPLGISVPFALTTYLVEFRESGLPTGSVLSDAQVTPFHGSSSTEFTWSATVNPRYLPFGDSGPLWLSVFVSTCPGATSNTSGVCAGGYPFIPLTAFFCGDPTSAATCGATAEPITQPTVVDFNYTLGSNGIWEWQMGLAVENLAVHVPTYTLLVGDPQYNGIEGPIIGSFGTLFEVVLPSVYLEDFLYLGLPFYAVLLLYAVFKNRERRREEARARNAGPIPPTSGAEAASAPSLGSPTAPLASAPASAAAASPAPGEHSCPNCGAVVYAGEAKCWKCGSPLSGNSPTPPG